MILHMCDVLRLVKHLGLSLLERDINFMGAETKVKTAVSELENLMNMLQLKNGSLYFVKINEILTEIDDRINL